MSVLLLLVLFLWGETFLSAVAASGQVGNVATL